MKQATADTTCESSVLEERLKLLCTTCESSVLEERPKLLCLPYVKGLSERIERCRNVMQNLKVVFKSQRTLRSILTNVKNRPVAEKVKKVVFKLNCSCGSTYVGETGRTLELHLKEHQRTVKNKQTTNGIAVHANNSHHSIHWDSAEVICRGTHRHKRKV